MFGTFYGVCSQFIFAGRDLKNITAATTVETQLYGRELHSLPQWQKLNCLPAWSTVNSQLTLFQNLQILRTIASGHDVIHTPAPFLAILFKAQPN